MKERGGGSQSCTHPVAMPREIQLDTWRWKQQVPRTARERRGIFADEGRDYFGVMKS